MDTAQLIALLLGTGGGGAIIVALIQGIGKWWSGAADRERASNQSLEAQRLRALEERDQANDERDEADAYRRVIAEYTSDLIGILKQNGLGSLVPPWPSNPTRKDRTHDSR